MKIVNNNKCWTYQFKYFYSVLKYIRTVEQAVLYKSFWLDSRQMLNISAIFYTNF